MRTHPLTCFGYRFDDQIAIGQGRISVDEDQPAEHRLALVLGHLVARHTALQDLSDGLLGGFRALHGEIENNRLDARACAHMGDAGAHLSGADHGDFFNHRETAFVVAVMLRAPP